MRFVNEVEELAFPENVKYRIIFVEDSSTDETVQILKKLAAKKPSVAFVSINNPYGQGHATYFGVGLSDSDAVITMDVDGSHPLIASPEMIRAFIEGATIVQCVRRKHIVRGAMRKFGASGFEILTRLLTGYDISLQNVHYRLMEKDLAKMTFGDARYWRTGRFRLPKNSDIILKKIFIDMPERTLGESKFNFFRLSSIAVDTMLSLMLPLRFIILVGIMAFVALCLSFYSSTLVLIIIFAVLFMAWRYVYILSGLSKSNISVIEYKNIEI
jgi:glycosyltransferase involved in cell wall biosynthesis